MADSGKDGDGPDQNSRDPGHRRVGVVSDADGRHPVGGHAGEHGHHKKRGEEPDGKQRRGEKLRPTAVSENHAAGDDEGEEAETGDEDDVKKGKGSLRPHRHQGIT